MHEQAIPRSDRGTQRAILALLLSEHPDQLTADDLAQEVGAGDATDRAIGDLVGAGLLRRDGESVLPTRAALAFARLEAS